MRGALPLTRARLEVDRALRQRAFFARALGGDLGRREYVDLVTQLASLADGAPGVRDAARSDLAALDADVGGAAGAPAAWDPGACLAPGLVEGLARARGLEPGLQANHVVLAILGTPWTQDAVERLESRFLEARALLSLLAREGPRSLSSLDAALRRSACDPRATFVFAELVRGALLGLAAHLEATWPAPAGALDLRFARLG